MQQTPNITMYAQTYLNEHRGIEESTRSLTALVVRYLAEVLQDKPIGDITIGDAERFKNWLLHKVKKTSANIYVKSIRPIFSQAVLDEEIPKNPFAAIKLFRVPKRQKIRIYESWEIRAIVGQAPNMWWRAIVLLGLLLRRGEVLNTTLADVDFRKGVLTVQPKEDSERLGTWRFQPKDYDTREIPLTPEANSLLVTISCELPDRQPYLLVPPKRYQWLMAHRDRLTHATRKCPIANFNREFHRIRKRAGIKHGTYHDLRRTGITMLLENGLQPHQVMQIAGHSQIETTINYYTATRDSLLNQARTALIGATGLEPATS